MNEEDLPLDCTEGILDEKYTPDEYEYEWSLIFDGEEDWESAWEDE